MLQQHTRSGLGRIVALALAASVIVPAAAVAKPAGEAFVPATSEPSISQNLVSPDARDAGAVGGVGTVSSQNLVTPDARDAGSAGAASTVNSQSLVSPDAKDVAAGRVVGAEQAPPVSAPVESTGGVDGWNIEVILGLAAAALMGIAGIALMARVRMRRPRTHTLA